MGLTKKIIKEMFEKFMEEREKLESDACTIKIDNKAIRSKAFGIMMKMKYHIRTYREHTYTINGLQKKALDKARIKYEVV